MHSWTVRAGPKARGGTFGEGSGDSRGNRGLLCDSQCDAGTTQQMYHVWVIKNPIGVVSSLCSIKIPLGNSTWSFFILVPGRSPRKIDGLQFFRGGCLLDLRSYWLYHLGMVLLLLWWRKPRFEKTLFEAKKQKVNQRTDERGCITWEVNTWSSAWVLR